MQIPHLTRDRNLLRRVFPLQVTTPETLRLLACSLALVLPWLMATGVAAATSTATVASAPAATSTAAPATGQQDQGTAAALDGWNGSRALELIQRARTVRADQQVDSAFRSYQSRANGFVYFFIDRPDEEERTLIKADQIALDVFWRAPNEAKQRIIGQRDEAVLPTNIKYHLDHLTVVQDDFGDRIRLGDGDEVEAVLHPAAPDSERMYDFRLADSLTISFGGVREPLRVYELQVRPKNPDAPGIVGSVFVDRASAALVRMSFIFTAASYVDPYLDYIRISLDNSLWMDKYWLPYRQEVEIRREMPAIDFLAGSIIRGRFEIGGYDFNLDLPDVLFRTTTVSAVPLAQREAFPFERGLFDDLEEAGLAPSKELNRIQSQVREMAMQQAVGGLNPLRLHWPSASDGLRYNRAEGWVTAVGTSFHVGETRLRLLGGWAFGPDELQAQAALSRRLLGGTGTFTWRQNRSRDLGPLPGASGIVNTLASAGGKDYSDFYHVSGGELAWDGPLMGRRFKLRLRAEEESGREITVTNSASFRAPTSITDQRRVSLRAAVEERTRWGGRLEVAGDVGYSESTRGGVGRAIGGLEVTAAWEQARFDDAIGALVEVRAGQRFGTVAIQDLYYLGGRGTVPGVGFRERAGDAYLLAGAEVGRTVVAPWLSLHLLARAGWTRADSTPSPDRALVYGKEGWLGSFGAGVDVLWETMRIDVMRGVPNGRWEVVFSVRPDLAGWM